MDGGERTMHSLALVAAFTPSTADPYAYIKCEEEVTVLLYTDNIYLDRSFDELVAPQGIEQLKGRVETPDREGSRFLFGRGVEYIIAAGVILPTHEKHARTLLETCGMVDVRRENTPAV